MHPTLGVVVEQGGGHLRAAGVVHADEQDLRDVGHDGSFGVGERGEAVGGERPEVGRRALEDGDVGEQPGPRASPAT